ncbi:cellulose synthase catalytic subunit [Thioclava sp. F36-7]|uniref:glycosyltransferase family 2 protein n=1 Tax=Thioclava sp. F36-7 TaxID=1915317 RepID=UPI0009D60E47|nr:cellulose synthase catalytic subunit [Thioclava sp. F36-7]OOY07146.1 hypothetical protein BMI89_19235 [Thioclava sp. F36-7]
MATFYAARSEIITPLPWTTFALPFSASKGALYFTRPDNADAKAGNINSAIARTDGDFFMVLDADFVPQRNFLYRAMGLFEDPDVGIVQIPHSFYNADPMQTNLGMRQVMPDDQRLFFGSIMMGRDGWDAAFCCGSNSITRRGAIEAVGGGLPTESITEDILLTLTLLRKGYVTRYLNERLAIGLAPESLSAMYVQRARWARGAIQTLYLRNGPFGPGLNPMQRILFFPSYWIVHPVMVLTTLLVPTICLWSRWSPLPAVPVSELVSYQLPALFATLGTLRLLAPKSFFPLAATVHSALLAPRILLTVVSTLIRPHGHVFKVTPKGRAADGRAIDRMMVFMPAALIVLTALGFFANANFNTRFVMSVEQLPILAIWAFVSMIVLSVVQAAAISATGSNRAERFRVDLSGTVGSKPSEALPVEIKWISMEAARLSFPDSCGIGDSVDWLRLDLPGIGSVAAEVEMAHGRDVEVKLNIPPGKTRDALLRALFTEGLENATEPASSLKISLAMMQRVFLRRRPARQQGDQPGDQVRRPPQWLVAATA